MFSKLPFTALREALDVAKTTKKKLHQSRIVSSKKMFVLIPTMSSWAG